MQCVSELQVFGTPANNFATLSYFDFQILKTVSDAKLAPPPHTHKQTNSFQAFLNAFCIIGTTPHPARIPSHPVHLLHHGATSIRRWFLHSLTWHRTFAGGRQSHLVFIWGSNLKIIFQFLPFPCTGDHLCKGCSDKCHLGYKPPHRHTRNGSSDD